MADRGLTFPAWIRSPLLGIVAVWLVAGAWGYVRLLDQQGDWPTTSGGPIFILSFLLVLAALSAVGTVARSADIRAAIAAAGAAGLISLGVLGLFSIGLGLIAAGIIAAIAWSKASRPPRERRLLILSLASALGTVAILAVGIVLTAT